MPSIGPQLRRVRHQRTVAHIVVFYPLFMTDQGIGIPQRELESIFNPFHRLGKGDLSGTIAILLPQNPERDNASQIHSQGCKES